MKRWKKEIQVHDIEPSLISCISTNEKSNCKICDIHTARYTCPRCDIQYCRVECYRMHKNNCTEAFYKDRVYDSLRNENNTIENKDIMTDILNRQYQSNSLIEDELMDLLERISVEKEETNENELEDFIYETLVSKPHLLELFERDVSNGKVSMDVWKPWWLPQSTLTSTSKLTSTLTLTSTSECIKTKTLDEQMLSIPSFDKLSKNTVALQYNVLHLLYTSIQILRLFNGSSNDPNASIPFLSISTVMSQDARYTCIEEVFINCVTQSTKEFQLFQTNKSLGKCNTSWEVLMQDLLYILPNTRYVCKLLFSLQDILQSNKDPTFKRSLRLAKKKCVFYISWCISYWSHCSSIVEDVHAWWDHWKSNHDEKDWMMKEHPKIQITKTNIGLKEVKTIIRKK